MSLVSNKKGFTQILTLMMAVMFILLGLYLAGPLSSFVEESRGNTTISYTNASVGLNCVAENISIYDKSSCVVVDMFTPVYLGILLGLAGLIIGAKVVLG